MAHMLDSTYTLLDYTRRLWVSIPSNLVPAEVEAASQRERQGRRSGRKVVEEVDVGNRPRYLGTITTEFRVEGGQEE